MTISVMSALDVAPQPWRNGGGATRELLAWPGAADWQVRISLADISQDGVFSQFAGVQRWFGVVHGAGVVLDFDGKQVLQTLVSDALQFDGAKTPYCSLPSGATQDINLMLRGTDAGRGAMQSVVSGLAWRNAMPLRALFVAHSGLWSDGVEHRRLQAFDFLWSMKAGTAAWRFDADARADEKSADMRVVGSWWLGTDPDPHINKELT